MQAPCGRRRTAHARARADLPPPSPPARGSWSLSRAAASWSSRECAGLPRRGGGGAGNGSGSGSGVERVRAAAPAAEPALSRCAAGRRAPGIAGSGPRGVREGRSRSPRAGSLRAPQLSRHRGPAHGQTAHRWPPVEADLGPTTIRVKPAAAGRQPESRRRVLRRAAGPAARCLRGCGARGGSAARARRCAGACDVAARADPVGAGPRPSPDCWAGRWPWPGRIATGRSPAPL
jgi:hypothetical protein